MKLILSTLFAGVAFAQETELRYKDKKPEFKRMKPGNSCNDITTKQAGLWIDMGHPDENIRMNDGCRQNSTTRCTVWCDGFDQHLVLDRRDPETWDKRIMTDKDKKLLLRCMCEIEGTDASGNDITGKCKWTKRRRWSKTQYVEDQTSNRQRRETDEDLSRATVYCEDDVSDEIKESWNIKEKEDGRAWRRPRNFDDCGDMTTNFPGVGGEWKCKDADKNHIEGSVVPWRGSCTWGCHNSTSDSFESRDARFTCYRPWIGNVQENGKDWTDKEAWRKFKGLGIRIFRQGLMTC